MDSAISLAIVLFILSMINERIANFIKLQFSDKKFLFIPLGNLKQKGTPSEEDDRTKRIIGLNMVCGTLVAIAIKADLITIINHIDKPWDGVGWDKPFEDYQYFTLIIGCFLTGCFLSLGSKFWHDLLDMLFTVKNLKQKALDERTYKDPVSVDALEEFLLTPDSSIADQAKTANEPAIKAVPGVLNIGKGYTIVSGQKISCIEVHVTRACDQSQIEKSYPLKLPKGKSVDVPTKIVVTGQMPSTSSVMASDGVRNATDILGTGTIGAIVVDKLNSQNKYILSCFHVLNGDSTWSRLSSTKTIEHVQNGVATEVATLTYGFRTQEIDAAIALLKNEISYSNNSLNNPTDYRSVTINDVNNETPVTIKGAKTNNYISGIVYHNTWTTKLKYPGGDIWELKDLILLTSRNVATGSFNTLTRGGDSGALVLDNKDRVLGMVVGGDDCFTYAIKADKIFDSFDIKF